MKDLWNFYDFPNYGFGRRENLIQSFSKKITQIFLLKYFHCGTFTKKTSDDDDDDEKRSMMLLVEV